MKIATTALEALFRREQAAERLWRWLLPGFGISLAGNLLALALFGFGAVAGPERVYFALLPAGGGQPMTPVSQPFSMARVERFAESVSEALFNFDHARSALHFRNVRIWFTDAGFAQFRSALREANWLAMLRERRGALTGELADGRGLEIQQVGKDPAVWILSGNVRLTLDTPGFEPAVDVKKLDLRIVPGDPAVQTAPVESVNPFVNHLGLRIDAIRISE